MIIYFSFLAKEEVSLELPEENLDYEEAEDRPEEKSEATEEDQKKDENTTAEVKSEDSKKSTDENREKPRKDSSDQTKSKSARVSIGKFTKGMVNSYVLIFELEPVSFLATKCQAIVF